MIPTYNCAHYLRQTLESVLAQDPGPEQMQIEVVDDCSTRDDPEAVVKEVGKGRVAFFRKEKNEGVTANFNTCIERSRGQLVHILHGDDYVEKTFYAEFSSAFAWSVECAGIFSRAFVVDENSELIGLSDRVISLQGSTNDAREIYMINPLRTPAAVVRRKFYEESGGFDIRFIHVADWEMWIRVIARGKARMLNRSLASYRLFEQNETRRLTRAADNLRDCYRLCESLRSQRLPDFDGGAFERRLVRVAYQQWKEFESKGDKIGSSSNFRFWRDHCTMKDLFQDGVLNWFGARSYLRAVKNQLVKAF